MTNLFDDFDLDIQKMSTGSQIEEPNITTLILCASPGRSWLTCCVVPEHSMFCAPGDQSGFTGSAEMACVCGVWQPLDPK